MDSNVVPHRSTNTARACLTSLSGREAVLSCLYGRSCHQKPYRNIQPIPTNLQSIHHSLLRNCQSYYQCGAGVYYASSLWYFSHVFVFFHKNFTITNIHPTTKAVWALVWETKLLLVHVSWIKSPFCLASWVLPVVSHFQQLLWCQNIPHSLSCN